MRVIVQPDGQSVGTWTAAHIVRSVAEHKPTAEHPFVLGLPAGTTPISTYRELVRLHLAGRISFEKIVVFTMDEYVGLPRDDPRTFRASLRRHLFDHVDIRDENLHSPDGAASDLQAACADYEGQIARCGGVHLFLGGIGRNGHLAFNEPGAPTAGRTHVATLTRDTRLANARAFEGDLQKVPSAAVTVGLGTVMDARAVVILAIGRSKATAVRLAIEGEVDDLCPASVLRLHPRAAFVCDVDAASELREDSISRGERGEGGGA